MYSSGTNYRMLPAYAARFKAATDPGSHPTTMAARGANKASSTASLNDHWEDILKRKWPTFSKNRNKNVMNFMVSGGPPHTSSKKSKFQQTFALRYVRTSTDADGVATFTMVSSVGPAPEMVSRLTYFPNAPVSTYCRPDETFPNLDDYVKGDSVSLPFDDLQYNNMYVFGFGATGSYSVYFQYEPDKGSAGQSTMTTDLSA